MSDREETIWRAFADELDCSEANEALGSLVAENQRLRDALAEIASETIRASADPLAIKTMSRMHHAARAALDGPKVSDDRTWTQALVATVRLSRRSLEKIGEGDWTPQDTAHWQLVRTVEEFLATNQNLPPSRHLSQGPK